MSNKIGEWLQRDPQPIDVYALLGRPRFDPDRQQLLVDVRVAYSELLPYQNHTNPELVCRALRLQMELGRAEAIISSPEKLRAHHIQLVEDLRAAYATAKGERAAEWSGAWNKSRRGSRRSTRSIRPGWGSWRGWCPGRTRTRSKGTCGKR
jgi:hypothetical protein